MAALLIPCFTGTFSIVSPLIFHLTGMWLQETMFNFGMEMNCTHTNCSLHPEKFVPRNFSHSSEIFLWDASFKSSLKRCVLIMLLHFIKLWTFHLVISLQIKCRMGRWLQISRASASSCQLLAAIALTPVAHPAVASINTRNGTWQIAPLCSKDSVLSSYCQRNKQPLFLLVTNCVILNITVFSSSKM